jgi:hypothetical protein
MLHLLRRGIPWYDWLHRLPGCRGSRRGGAQVSGLRQSGSVTSDSGLLLAQYGQWGPWLFWYWNRIHGYGLSLSQEKAWAKCWQGWPDDI